MVENQPKNKPHRHKAQKKQKEIYWQLSQYSPIPRHLIFGI